MDLLLEAGYPHCASALGVLMGYRGRDDTTAYAMPSRIRGKVRSNLKRWFEARPVRPHLGMDEGLWALLHEDDGKVSLQEHRIRIFLTALAAVSAEELRGAASDLFHLSFVNNWAYVKYREEAAFEQFITDIFSRAGTEMRAVEFRRFKRKAEVQ